MILKYLTNEQIKQIYLVYVNDFLSVERFAEHMGLEFITANDLINKARQIINYEFKQ